MEDWRDGDGDSGEYPHEDPPLNQQDILTVDTRHSFGHITMGNTSPRDTWPHTCYILNQNINGLGGKSNDNLEKLVLMMIARKMHAYCIQETWQLRNYMITIRGYTVFHHGMDEKPQQLGRTSSGVMDPALNQQDILTVDTRHSF